MTSRNDLYELEHWEGVPYEHRLAVMIDGMLTGEKYEESVAALAQALGYIRPEGVKQWLKHTTRIPLRQLPAIGVHLNIGLGVLIAMWIAKEAPEDMAEQFYQAARPRVTDREAGLIEMARTVFDEDTEDAAEAQLVEDLRRE